MIRALLKCLGEKSILGGKNRQSAICVRSADLTTDKAVDESVGRMLKYLDDNGLAENTIVIYSSDQGFFLGEHGWYDKRWMFEESFRMPFLVRWPGVVDPGEMKSVHANPEYQQIRQQLTEEFHRLRQQFDAPPLPVPRR